MAVNIGVLVSGEGTNLQAIMDSVESGKIKNAKLSVVISNKPDAPALERAEKHGIDAVYIDPTDYKGRRWEYDQLTLKTLHEHGVTSEAGLVVNAGYMRILSPEFVRNFWMREMSESEPAARHQDRDHWPVPPLDRALHVAAERRFLGDPGNDRTHEYPQQSPFPSKRTRPTQASGAG